MTSNGDTLPEIWVDGGLVELVGAHTQIADSSGILVPNTWYLSPSSAVIQDKGLTPTVEAEGPDNDFGAPEPEKDTIDEAAQIDGASHWVTFARIILPMIRPILAVIAIISFIGSFNDYLLPRVLLSDKSVYTLAVGMTIFLNNQFSVNWGVFSAGALIGAVPIIIIFLLLQTQIISGLTRGAVKG